MIFFYFRFNLFLKKKNSLTLSALILDDVKLAVGGSSLKSAFSLGIKQYSEVSIV